MTAGNFLTLEGITLTVRFDDTETVVDVDADGIFIVRNIGIPYGVYTVCVKEMRSLALCQKDVIIPTTDPPVEFGALVSGDADDDNDVDFDDFLLLAMKYRSPEYLLWLDFDNDGRAPGPDFNDFVTLAMNYGKKGDHRWSLLTSQFHSSQRIEGAK